MEYPTSDNNKKLNEQLNEQLIERNDWAINHERFRLSSPDANDDIKRLKRRAQLRQHECPYWEWDIEQGEYITADLWENLTGFKTFDVFPNLKPGESPEHDDLVSLIDRWAQLIYKEDRIEACDRAREFLLGRQQNKVLNLVYRIVTSEGKVVTVESTAMTIWSNKKTLLSLFCETRDLSEYDSPPTAAGAIAHNAAKIKSFDQKLDGATKTLDKATKTLKKLTDFWPLVAGFILFAGDGFVLISSQLKRARDVIFNPVQTAIADKVFTDELLPDWVTSSVLIEALSQVKPLGRLGTATLYAYDPGNYPAEYTPLLEASSTEQILFADGTSAYVTSTDPGVSERTRQHLSGQVYLGALDGTFSVPFHIGRPDGRVQTFFIQVKSDKQLSVTDIAEATAVAGEVRTIFEE